jgi:hypothetical protein
MSIEKYLTTYAEKESTLNEGYPLRFASRGTPSFKVDSSIYDSCLVVPCVGEYETFLNLKESIEASAQHCAKNILVIVVINATPKTPFEYQQKNKRLYEHLLKLAGEVYPLRPSGGEARPLPLTSTDPLNNVHYLLIDRFSDQHMFSDKDGVGLARKIGCDIALNLIHQKKISSPYIHTTDADATLPLNYFEPLEKGPSLYIHSYRHWGEVEPEVLEATQIYESFLDYYVKGLKFAKSIYAFDTIGSTFSILDKSYALVRGFPKKNAGEDFYLFNKLRKVGDVKNSGRVITLLPRVSERVPFGTGVSTKKILNKLQTQEEITFYDPRCFLVLKDILNQENLEKYQELTVVKKLQANLNQAKSYRKTNKDFLKHFEDYFDAFQILKLVHESTEKLFPKINYRRALDLLPQL